MKSDGMRNYYNNNQPLPLTIGFVDYESWYWSLFNLYGETPNINTALEEIKARGKLEDLFIFGDFTSELMQKERAKLRSITNNIIDCANIDSKKEYTDFIMLDHIYQTILKQPQIDQYVLITGDGHFHSVVAYLKNFKDKEVGILAVKGSFSQQLKNTASWYLEIQPTTNVGECRPKILQSISWAESKGIIPTFSGTVKAVEKFHGIDVPKANAALRNLIEQGYIEQVTKSLQEGREIRAIEVNWELAKKHGVWDPNSN